MRPANSHSPMLEVRNLKFDVDGSLPRKWHGKSQAVTSFFNNLSIFFPPGERFFIASVNAHRKKVFDDRLLEEIRAFCGQEGIHSREHDRYNAMLRDQGYPVVEMEERIRLLLARLQKRLPKRWRLAATCALEHFTALMGQILLEDPRILEGAHPVMAQLWHWHSAEENEHKATAFDVYMAAGGNYPERTLAMLVATIVFWSKVFEHQVRLMQTDGILFSRTEWQSLLRWMFVEPGWVWPLSRHYLAYFRPGFHPHDIDTRELLEAWRASFATTYDLTEAALAKTAS